MRGGGFAANLPHLKEMQLSKDAKYHFFSLNKAVEGSRNILKRKSATSENYSMLKIHRAILLSAILYQQDITLVQVVF